VSRALKDGINIIGSAMNSPAFTFVPHVEGFSHERHSFSRLNRCYRVCGALAFAWLCQEPLMNGVRNE